MGGILTIHLARSAFQLTTVPVMPLNALPAGVVTFTTFTLSPGAKVPLASTLLAASEDSFSPVRAFFAAGSAGSPSSTAASVFAASPSAFCSPSSRSSGIWYPSIAFFMNSSFSTLPSPEMSKALMKASTCAGSPLASASLASRSRSFSADSSASSFTSCLASARLRTPVAFLSHCSQSLWASSALRPEASPPTRSAERALPISCGGCGVRAPGPTGRRPS
mmetsp:Transcript_73036/g.225854  ORF Transcript_73036/g.225854 Transcript_73036/m.225854 type:complete len:221 (-) Transcript_73036:2-664(-)